MAKTFLLVDANSLIHRAFHALPPLTDKKGRPVNALYGFSRMLLAAIRQYQPEYLAVAFDEKGPTFRDKEYAEYKATRVKAPDELYQQIPLVKEFLDALEVPHFGLEGFEADDLIATLKDKAEKELKDYEIIILTGDNDALQLIDEKTKISLPARGIQPPTLFDKNALKGKFGLEPKEMIDYKALRGDPSDNIPGVKGIGEKTATKLIQRFGSIEKVYENLSQIESEKLRQLLTNDKETAFLSKKLVILRHDVPLPFSIKAAKVEDYDKVRAENFIREMGMLSLLKILPDNNRHEGQQEALF